MATIVGLCLAFGGTGAIAYFGDKFPDIFDNLTAKIIQQLVLIGLFVAVLEIVVFWEKQPLSSVGFQPPGWHSILWGVLFAGIFIFLYSPILIGLIHRLQLLGFERGLSTLTHLPRWYLILAVVVGGVVEEGLYRGYATTRLVLLTGSYWIGIGLALAAFGLAHVPLWGWIPASTTVLSGAVLTLFYLATGDLLTVIIAHVLTDAVGLMISPKTTDLLRNSV